MDTLKKDLRFWICGILILILISLSIFAPLLTPYKFDKMDASNMHSGPSREHIMGTDEFGRDIWTRIIYGGRLTFTISLGAVLISLVFGTLLGMTAGFRGGIIELIIMRIIDFMMSFPTILVAMFVVIFIGSSVPNLILTIGVLSIGRYARIAHSATLTIIQNEYVEAAKSMGSTDIRILFKTILPNIWAPLLVQISLSLGDAMLAESSLSFLGLGPPPNIPSWGRSISEASRFMHINPWSIIWPSLTISLCVLAFSILGDAMRDALDPRLKER